MTPRPKFSRFRYFFEKIYFNKMRRLLQRGKQHTKRQFNTLSSVDHFAQHFKSTFPKEKKRPIRAIGREAEYPVRTESTLTSLHYILRNARTTGRLEGRNSCRCETLTLNDCGEISGNVQGLARERVRSSLDESRHSSSRRFAFSE